MEKNEKQKELDSFWHEEYKEAVKEWTIVSNNFNVIICLLNDYQREKKFNGKLKHTIYWLCNELNKYVEEHYDWEEICKDIEVDL